MRLMRVVPVSRLGRDATLPFFAFAAGAASATASTSAAVSGSGSGSSTVSSADRRIRLELALLIEQTADDLTDFFERMRAACRSRGHRRRTSLRKNLQVSSVSVEESNRLIQVRRRTTLGVEAKDLSKSSPVDLAIVDCPLAGLALGVVVFRIGLIADGARFFVLVVIQAHRA